MERLIQRSRAGARRGFILAVSMILLFISALGALMMARSVIEGMRLSGRRNDLSRAFYAAEAGANQVAHWAIYPQSFSPNPALFARDTQGDYPELRAALSAGEYEVPESVLPILSAGAGYRVSDVKKISLLKPEPTDPASSLFKILSVGHTESGVERSVIYFAQKNPMFEPKVPAALISMDAASATGNFRLHWGEAWIKGNVTIPSRPQMAYLQSNDPARDPWAKYRTEGTINFPNSWRWGSGKDLFDPARSQPGLAPASGQYADAFYQKAAKGLIQFPTYDYDTWKSFCRAHGKYYSTNSSGQVFHGNEQNEETRVRDFLLEFEVADRANAPYDVVFIDTVDGRAPATDGSNMATLRISGDGAGLKAAFYVCANIDASGVGNPPSLQARDPQGTVVTLSKILLDGVLICPGTVALSGNAGVYGSVIAGRGFAGTGTPDIYFNAQFQRGIPSPSFGSPLKLAMWKNY